MQVWRGFCGLAVIASLALPISEANAGARKYRTDDRLAATSLFVGLGTTAGFFALRGWKFNGKGPYHGVGRAQAFVMMTAACLAVSPIVGTVAVGRELTYREAYGLFADCVIPFVGSYLVDRAFDANPQGERAIKAQARARR